MPTITIYTDGSALGNPGPGGYGAVLLSGRHRKELSQGFRLTTNNRMELMAVCVALGALKVDVPDDGYPRQLLFDYVTQYGHGLRARIAAHLGAK